MSVNLEAEMYLLSLFCKHGFEQNRAEDKTRERGKACFNVGLNFPEKHAKHLKSYLQCIILLSSEIFSTVSIKVKTLKSFLTITDRQKDRLCPYYSQSTRTDLAQFGHPK